MYAARPVNPHILFANRYFRLYVCGVNNISLRRFSYDRQRQGTGPEDLLAAGAGCRVQVGGYAAGPATATALAAGSAGVAAWQPPAVPAWCEVVNGTLV